MTRVLVVSGDPVGTRMAGPGIRALEIARALAARGLDVTLAIPGGALAGEPFASFGYDSRGAALRAAAETSDAIVIGGMSMAQFPFLGASDKPLVIDIYGPFVLENLPAGAISSSTGRARARRHAGDVAVLDSLLARGDFFVCASEVQRDFWLGALTALGRLNPATYADDPELRRLIDIVPFGLPADPPRAAGPALRGVVPGIGPDDRVVLWGGGIWDWLDPQTLIRAVAEVARERDDVRLFFMGTRSPSPAVPTMATQDEAICLARSLGLLDSVVFFNRGWVPYAERAGYLLEADVGASFHRPHIETRFAFRTRLLDYVWAGLPMLVTEGDVLAERVKREGVGHAVAPGDVRAASDALREMLSPGYDREALAARFDRLRELWTWDRAVEPLARFLASPRRAADRPTVAGEPTGLAPTPMIALPGRVVEVWREGGPFMLLEEAARYVRWRRRPRS